LTLFKSKHFYRFSFIGLAVYFIQFTTHLYAFDLPVKVNCTNNVCDCIRIEKTVFNIKQIIDFIFNNSELDSTLIACCYHQVAIEYYYEFDDALNSVKYNKEAEKIRTEKNDGLLWRSKLNLGMSYHILNEFKKALSYFEEALLIKGVKDESDSIAIYSNLAESIFLKNSDFDTAIDFASKSIQIKGNQLEINSALNTLSSILINSKDSINLVEAIKYSNKALQSSKSIQDVVNVEIAFNNLAFTNKLLGNFDNAILFYQQAIDVTDKTDLLSKATVLNNISVVYKDQKSYDLSIETLKKSLDIYKQYYELDYNFDYSAVFENLADNYVALEQFETALLYYQKALVNLTNNFHNKNIFQNPNPKDGELFIYSNPDIIRVLHLKATATYQYYHQKKQEKFIKLANQTYQTAFDFHDKLQKEISTENSRLFQAKNIVPYIENALKIAFQQQEMGQDVSKAAFRFMEKNKATVLLQSMNEADALQFANLPDSLLEQEKDLKIAITFHKKQLNDAIEQEDTIAIEHLNKILFDEKQQYNQLFSNLEKNHTEYYNLKYQQNQIELSTVQNDLDDNTALLEYFVGDSYIYILSIQKEKAKLFKLKKPGNWRSTINTFRNAVSLNSKEAKENPYTRKLYQQFSQSAYQLFQWLIKEPIADLDDNIHHLKIVPDGELNYIPFEILLTEMPNNSTVNYKKLPYLIKQNSIGYNYSAALMMEQKQTANHQRDLSYGGYAAQYSITDSIKIDLPEIRDLVAETAHFFKGKAYLNDKATKAEFLKDGFSYNVLHFAMHGILNDQYPLNSHLVFTQNTQNTQQGDYKLYAADLYNLQLNTDLAVLSACDTGAGELQKGEGVMSLSRAFTYAGCPSLVMSLWSIPEKSTSGVLNYFFKGLKKGKTKDMLENTSATTSHPNYWAGLVLTGNAEVIHFKSYSNKLWWGLALLFVLVGFFVFKNLTQT